MQCNFTVGQRVVSICGDWHIFDKNESLKGPPKGAICKIVAMSVCKFSTGDHVLLSLKEYPGVRCAHWGFRPLQERPKQTDITIFKKLLANAPKQMERQE